MRTMKNEPSVAIPNAGQTTQWSLKTMRSAFLLLLILSCAPPLIHFRLVDEVFESLRGPVGLLPGQYLFLRHFGELSAWFPPIILAAFGWSFSRPGHTLKLLTAITLAFLSFTVAYCCYALVVISLLAHDRGA